MRSFSLVALAVLALAACGTQSNPPTGDPAEPSQAVQYLARAVTVLDNGTDGPQMCTVVLTSMPPQCSGPVVIGWDWNDAEHEEANRVRWGEYDLVGTWADGTFTLTEPPAEPTHSDDDSGPDLTSPCPDARPVGKSTQEDADVAVRIAGSLEGVADVWIDQNLGDEELGDDLQAEEKANNPDRIILNVSTTGDVAEAESAVRAVWPGRLCVVTAERSSSELAGIHKQVEKVLKNDPARYVMSSTGFGHVDVTVWLDVDNALKKRFDTDHGEGVVVVSSLLQAR